MANKGGIISGIITLVIGGTVYSVSQADVARNFSKNTGMSQEEAQQYVENVSEDDLEPYEKVGSEMIADGQKAIETASDMDCVNYTYEWESPSLSCQEGKAQLKRIGNDEIALGKAYTTLASETASKEDISITISQIDKVNADLSLRIVRSVMDATSINELRNNNSYNKALLQTALDSK